MRKETLDRIVLWVLAAMIIALPFALLAERIARGDHISFRFD